MGLVYTRYKSDETGATRGTKPNREALIDGSCSADTDTDPHYPERLDKAQRM